MTSVVRDVWLNFCVDLESLLTTLFKKTHASIEEISIGPCVKVRRIFTVKDSPMNLPLDDCRLIDSDPIVSVSEPKFPRQYEFPSSTAHQTQIFSYKTLEKNQEWGFIASDTGQSTSSGSRSHGANQQRKLRLAFQSGTSLSTSTPVLSPFASPRILDDVSIKEQGPASGMKAKTLPRDNKNDTKTRTTRPVKVPHLKVVPVQNSSRSSEQSSAISPSNRYPQAQEFPLTPSKVGAQHRTHSRSPDAAIRETPPSRYSEAFPVISSVMLTFEEPTYTTTPPEGHKRVPERGDCQHSLSGSYAPSVGCHQNVSNGLRRPSFQSPPLPPTDRGHNHTTFSSSINAHSITDQTQGSQKNNVRHVSFVPEPPVGRDFFPVEDQNTFSSQKDCYSSRTSGGNRSVKDTDEQTARLKVLFKDPQQTCREGAAVRSNNRSNNPARSCRIRIFQSFCPPRVKPKADFYIGTDHFHGNQESQNQVEDQIKIVPTGTSSLLVGSIKVP